jgi:hypothetical protein
MTPGVFRPAAAHSAAKCLASGRVAIMGAMTHTSASESAAAWAIADSWRSSTPGVVQSVR